EPLERSRMSSADESARVEKQSVWRGFQRSQKNLLVLTEPAVQQKHFFVSPSGAVSQEHQLVASAITQQTIQLLGERPLVAEEPRRVTADPPVEPVVVRQHRAPRPEGFDERRIGPAYLVPV